jgi:hypothetical protein
VAPAATHATPTIVMTVTTDPNRLPTRIQLVGAMATFLPPFHATGNAP